MAARLTTYLVVAIVATTLIAGLIVGAQRDDSEGPVDLIVHNAAIYTADGDGTTAGAIAVRGNQILRVGSNREITRLRRPQTTVIDAKGATVLPGFNDAHVRLVEGGLSLGQVDLLGAATLAEVQGRIRAWLAANPDADWVIGRGWNPAAFGRTPPSRQMLDALVGERPAQLMSEDGSALWVSTRAFELSGLLARPDPWGQEPGGVVSGEAMALVRQTVPQPGRAARERALRAAIQEAHRLGVTSVHDIGASAGDIALYGELHGTGNLNLRIYPALALDGPVDDAVLARLDAVWKEYADDPLFKTGAVAIEVDGGIDSRTASMLEPYADRALDGAMKIAPDDLNRFTRLFDARGWQVMALASGDHGVRMALNAFLHATRSNPPPERGRRHRVEGADLIDPADVPRFDVLGVLASLQPSRVAPTQARIEAWSRGLGPRRVPHAWPLGSLSEHGARLAIGSGWPAAALNPMFGLHAAVTRTGLAGQPTGGWTPAERLDLAAAIDGYTSGPAHASFDEQRKGALAAGMLADLVVLSDDIFTLPAERLASATVDVTIFDGKVVYRRDPDGSND